MAVGQSWNNLASNETGKFSSRMSPELSGFLSKAKQGLGRGTDGASIVQYRQVPTAAHYATMQNRGGRLHNKLHMIKGAAFTVPVSASAPHWKPIQKSLRSQIDHPMNVMDDLTNGATGVFSVWNFRLYGSGRRRRRN